jgi:REP element-mobilizing transposase RayT
LRSSAALGGEREFWIVGLLLPTVIITRMWRLRRLVLSDRWFFITCRVLPRRQHLSDSEFATLAQVIPERRAEHRFLLTAWVFIPDHGHAIFYPPHPLTISRVMEAGSHGQRFSDRGPFFRLAKKSRRGTQKA